MEATGRKDDAGKRRWSLLPWGPLGEVVDVLTAGAKRYGPNNWQIVPEAKERYTDALMRHFTAWMLGEKADPDTGKSHLAHLVCNALFLLWFEMMGFVCTPRKTDETFNPENKNLLTEDEIDALLEAAEEIITIEDPLTPAFLDVVEQEIRREIEKTPNNS